MLSEGRAFGEQDGKKDMKMRDGDACPHGWQSGDVNRQLI